MVQRPGGYDSASDSTRIRDAFAGSPHGGVPCPGSCRDPHRVMVGALPSSDRVRSQHRPVKKITIVSSDLHAVTVPLDGLWDIMIELAAALTSDSAGRVVTAIGSRLTESLCNMEIEDPHDAMVLDLAPILAASRHSRGDTFDATDPASS